MNLNELYNYKIEVTSLTNKNVIDLFVNSKNISLLSNRIYDQTYNYYNETKKQELYDLVNKEVKIWSLNISKLDLNGFNNLQYYNNLFIKYFKNKYLKNEKSIDFKINNDYNNISLSKYIDQYTDIYSFDFDKQGAKKNNNRYGERALYTRNYDKNDGNNSNDSLDNLQYKSNVNININNIKYLNRKLN